MKNHLYPFIIFSKKRYVGNLYEFDINKFKQKSMGIVLKRRDNANIVKKIYGGVIDILLNKQDLNESIEFLNDELT
jgi:DNA polymerase elongation subunit (family B)